ncbi:MAG: methyltransferase domain-containing protein [Victivallaceae bacterium]|jgi:SAM-dependent methyltransferase
MGRGWKPGTLYHHSHQERYFHAVKTVEAALEKNKTLPLTILDIGYYPGALGIILREIFGDKIRLTGSGMGSTPGTIQELLDSKAYAEIHDADLDPLHYLYDSNAASSRIQVPDASIDLVIAGEVFEHLSSPIHFIKEISRVLKKDGILFMTTPNVCYIGNIFRLLTQKSNFPPLEASTISIPEQRPHIRLYDAGEIRQLMADEKLEEVKYYFIDGHDERFKIKPLSVKIKLFIIRCFYFIPHFRDQYIGIFYKA